MRRTSVLAPLCEGVARLALGRPRVVLALSLLVLVLALVGGFPPRIDGDLTALMPPDDPAVVDLKALVQRRGGRSLVVMGFSEDRDLDALQARAEALPSIDSAWHRLDDELALRLGLLNEDPARLRSLAARVESAMRVNNPFVTARLLDISLPRAPRLLPEGLLVVLPAVSSNDSSACETVLDELLALEPLWLEGAHATVAEAMRGIRSDLLRTSLISLVLVTLVTSLAFRDWRATLMLFPPLVAGALVALTLVQWIDGALNLYTSLGTALLFGLGVDTGIHLVSRYRDERAAGLEPEAAVLGAWRGTGPACLVASATSAGGFLALTTGHFRGLSQLGLALSVGLCVCVFAMLLLLPPLLVWMDPPPGRAASLAPDPPSRLRGVWALVLLLSLGVGAWQLPQLGFNYDLSSLREAGQGWSELAAGRRDARELAFPPVVVPVASAEQRVAEAERLRGLLAGLTHVKEVLSLESVLPSDQEPSLAAQERLVQVARDPRLATLPAAVREALAPLAGLEPRALGSEQLPAPLAFWLGADSPQVLLVVRGNLMDLRESRALRRELDGVVTGAGSPFLTHGVLLDLLREELPRILLLALGAVGLIVVLDLRSLGGGLLALSTLVLGLVWAGCGLAAWRLRLNLSNVVGLPILVGIGVDVVIHLLHRFEQEGEVSRALRTTGLAALVSTLTTVVAFIALLGAGSRGVRSIGSLVVLGLVLVYLTAVAFLPSAWEALRPGARASSPMGPDPVV